jgi:CHAT domain-containing protein
LTILSACDSGLALVSAADDPLGMPFVVALAGSRTVIASLWPVPDQATMLMMADLHRRLIAGAPPADALAQSQSWLRTLAPDTAAVELGVAREFLTSLPELPAAIRRRAATDLDQAIAMRKRHTSPPTATPNTGLRLVAPDPRRGP